MTRLKVFILSITLVLTVAVQSAVAVDYYVATDGQDFPRTCNGAQSPGTPMRTINYAAAQCLTPGDTLYVRAGTYQGAVSAIPNGSSWSNPVTVAAYPGETVTLRRIDLAGKSYIVIDGFIVDTDADLGVVGIQASGADHILISNTEVRNAPWHGILGGQDNGFANGGQYSEFLNLNVHDNGYDCPDVGLCHGIYLSGIGDLIDGGSYYNNTGHGIHMYNNPENNAGTPDYTTIKNVRVYGNGGPGIGIYWATDNKVYNNIIYNNFGGIRANAVNSFFVGNTIYNNFDYEIWVDNSGNTIEDNIDYNNGS